MTTASADDPPVAEFPPCARPGCGHTAWCHGGQSGHPSAADPCHAAASACDCQECPCDGYVRTAPSESAAGPPGATESSEAGSSPYGHARGSYGAPQRQRPDPETAQEPPDASEAPVRQSETGEGREAAHGAVEGADTPAARLRRAADLLGQRAAAATPGPWRTNDVEGIFYVASAARGPVTMDNDNPVCVCDYDREGVAIERTEGEGGRADGEWMALMSPAIAAPLAALLRTEATWCAETSTGNDPYLRTIRALALADSILGEADR